MNQGLTSIQQKEISVAPMMDWTDRHCRFFHRLIAPHARLYTEMVTTGAILNGDTSRFLRFDPAEHPIALQLGGSEPAALAECAKIGEKFGYDEINLNCGCPSDRVQDGRFGACLMKEPAHVADCVEAMVNAVQIPVTVKCRIGIDDQDDFEFLDKFVSKIAEKGCTTFIIHARKAWLQGLSPKENREKPPLDYRRASDIREKYPHVKIVLNGGLTGMPQIAENINKFDGLMIGREAYQNPWFLQEIEQEFFKAKAELSRESVALQMVEYAKKQNELYATPIKSITRHILGLYYGRPRGKIWRRVLSTLPHENDADERVILQALKEVSKA